MPGYVQAIGQGTVFGVPAPLLRFRGGRPALVGGSVAHPAGLRDPDDRVQHRGDPLLRRSDAAIADADLYACPA